MEKFPESIESSMFVSHRARVSGEFDPRKDSQSIIQMKALNICWKLDCSLLQRLELKQDFFLVRTILDFLKDFLDLLNSSEGIWQGQLTGEGVREDSSPGRIQPVPLLETQNFRWKNVTEFPVVSGCVFY